MSFFGNLNGGGIKGPDVVINGDGGSLLPTGQSGMRFSSAQINKQDSLLSGINAYDYGQGSVSDDIAYQVTSHKIQKIVPQFRLPSAQTTSPDDITLCHSVSDGDLAFTIRLVHDMQSRMKNYNYFEKQKITRAVDPIINLSTVNYILRGLQTNMDRNDDNWSSFLQATGWPVDKSSYEREAFYGGPYQHRNVSMFIQDYIRPLGVVIGSDMQGGQHQGGGTVDFPVDYVVTILVDGLCDNMLNLWRRTDIKAGCDLLLALVGYNINASTYDPADIAGRTFKKKQPREVGPINHQVNDRDGINSDTYCYPTAKARYTLNHWGQGMMAQDFHDDRKVDLLFELVPTTSDEIDEGVFLGDDRRNRGLWHVARSQVYIRGLGPSQRHDMQTFRNDMANLRGGGLVQSTIAPVWKSATRCVGRKGHPHVTAVHHDEPEDTTTPYSFHASGAGPHASGAGPPPPPGGPPHAMLVGGSHKKGGTEAAIKMQPGYIPVQAQPIVSTARRNTPAQNDAMETGSTSTAKRRLSTTVVNSDKNADADHNAALQINTPVQADKVRKVSGADAMDVEQGVDVKSPTNSIRVATVAPKVYARSLAVGEDVSSGKTVTVARVPSRKRADDAPLV
ncbi:hypothetical protein T484DRAFT_1757790 [Baffinella frigidus]|nr:hypothetical protein T484DRAFT_1757790 [Cryptophyta sp. CCMP2293]